MPTGTPCSSVVLTKHFSLSHTTSSPGSPCHSRLGRAETRRTRHPGALWAAASSPTALPSWGAHCICTPRSTHLPPCSDSLMLLGTQKGNRICHLLQYYWRNAVPCVKLTPLRHGHFAVGPAAPRPRHWREGYFGCPQTPRHGDGQGAQSLLAISPVLTGPQTSRGVPQLTPGAFRRVGSLQEPEGSKCFLQEPQGAKGGEGKGTGGKQHLVPCLSSALSPLGFSAPSTSPPWHTGTLLRKPSLQETSQTTQPPPTAQPAHRDLPWSRTPGRRGRRRRREGRCTARAENLSTPPSHLCEQKAEPYLAAAPCSLQQAGRLGELRSAGNRNLPPATNFMENKLSPCRTEQLGLGMWARSRPGLRRGERGCMAGGGVPATQSPFELPSAGGTRQDLSLPKRVVRSSSRSPHRRLPFPEPPLLICWTPAIGSLKVDWAGGRREGRAGKSRGGSAAPSLFPRLSELPHPEKEAWLWAAAMAAASEEEGSTGQRDAKPLPATSPAPRAVLGISRVCLESRRGFTAGHRASPRRASRALQLLPHPLLMEGFAAGG